MRLCDWPGQVGIYQEPATFSGGKQQLKHISAAGHNEDMLTIRARPAAPGGFYQIAAPFPDESEWCDLPLRVDSDGNFDGFHVG